MGSCATVVVIVGVGVVVIVGVGVVVIVGVGVVVVVLALGRVI
jgi:hypothetical protein